MTDLHPDCILRLSEVMTMVGLGRTVIYHEMNLNRFPQSIELSPGRVGWWESEITEWLRTRPRRKNRAQDRAQNRAPADDGSTIRTDIPAA